MAALLGIPSSAFNGWLNGTGYGTCAVNWARGTAASVEEAVDEAVRMLLLRRAAAGATYGHISKWVTGGVTDMSYLFCAPLEDDDEDEDEDGDEDGLVPVVKGERAEAETEDGAR